MEKSENKGKIAKILKEISDWKKHVEKREVIKDDDPNLDFEYTRDSFYNFIDEFGLEAFVIDLDKHIKNMKEESQLEEKGDLDNGIEYFHSEVTRKNGPYFNNRKENGVTRITITTKCLKQLIWERLQILRTIS